MTHAPSRNHAGLRPDGSLKAYSAHWTVFDKTCPVRPATHHIARRDVLAELARRAVFGGTTQP